MQSSKSLPSCHYKSKQFEPKSRPCTTPPFPPKVKDSDPKPYHHWPQKVIDSNPPPCTSPPLSPKRQSFEPHHHWPPKSQRFEPKTMHYTIIDPKCKRFEPKTMHYATIDPQKSNIRTHDHALHHHWPPKRQRLEPKTIVGHWWRHP
jgi:hypothetical protein